MGRPTASLVALLRNAAGNAATTSERENVSVSAPGDVALVVMPDVAKLPVQLPGLQQQQQQQPQQQQLLQPRQLLTHQECHQKLKVNLSQYCIVGFRPQMKRQLLIQPLTLLIRDLSGFEYMSTIVSHCDIHSCFIHICYK